jgi:hypothetical protein
MRKRTKLILAAVVLAVVGLIYLLTRRTTKKVVPRADYSGWSGPIPEALRAPTIKGGGSQATSNQPPAGPQTSRVVVQLKQLAALLPEVAAPLCQGLNLHRLATVLRYDGKGTAYAESGIRQKSRVNRDFWTWVQITIWAATTVKWAVETIRSGGEGEHGTRTAGFGGGLPAGGLQGGQPPATGGTKNEAVERAIGFVKLLERARASVEFEVDASSQNAAEYLLESALGTELRVGEQATVDVAGQPAALVDVIKASVS